MREEPETKPKPIRGTVATYREDGELVCDLEELAQTYRNVGSIPEHLGWSRACEIAVLCQAFLVLYKKHQTTNKKRRKTGKKKSPSAS